MNCAKAQQNTQYRYLVDKVVSYDSVFVYLYDEENKLVKNPHGYFEYENGLVSKILYRNPLRPQDDIDVHCFYNSKRQLIRFEEYKYGYKIHHTNYYYENGRVVSIYADNTLPFQHDSIFYDNSGNVIKHASLRGNDPKWFTSYFEYDNNPKPSFSIDYLFIHMPFPWMGFGNSFPQIFMGLSKNNMTAVINGISTFNYTYNEYGLPETIEHVIDQLGVVNFFTITYRQVELGVSEPGQDLSEITVFPNPTTGQLRITNYELRFTDVEVFDIYGRKVSEQCFVFAQQQKAESEAVLDISHLHSGIYLVKIKTEKGVVVKKVVKR